MNSKKKISPKVSTNNVVVAGVPKKKLTVEEKYKHKNHRQHIYDLPDTYIGSIEKDDITLWVFNNDGTVIEKKIIKLPPGLYKIFDEIIVNACDHCIREKTCREIKVDIDKETGTISVYNNGTGIEVQIHKVQKIYVPQMIFGLLMSSGNYDQKEEKIVGGKNGFGAKLTNIFSTKFIVDTCDGKHKYHQVFEKNMKVVGEPEITPAKKGDVQFTKITFVPDYKKFGMEDGLTEDIINLFKRRVYDVSAYTIDLGVKVYWNGSLVNINTFEDYVKLYYKEPAKVKMASGRFGDRWKICAVFEPQNGFNQISFVNGISTYKGGTHVAHVMDQISEKLKIKITELRKLKGIDIKPAHIRENLTLFLSCAITNPSFDSQTKENLTTKVANFGSKVVVGNKFITDLYGTGIADEVVELAKFKQDRLLKDSDGKKSAKLRDIEKLVDAEWAGGRKSRETRLFLTEGDSARKFALDGIGVLPNGHEKFGAFPLRGKFLNVREATVKQLANNTEFCNLKKILGLKQGEKYTDVSKLRYGGIIILTDADVDGSHIKGLLINMLEWGWPSLLKIKGFVQTMQTPIVKAFSKRDKERKNPLVFYTLTDYENWAKQGKKGWDVDYYKGLGSHEDQESLDCFADFDNKIVSYIWETSGTEKKPAIIQETEKRNAKVVDESDNEGEGDDEDEDADEQSSKTSEQSSKTSKSGKSNHNDEDELGIEDSQSPSHQKIVLAFAKKYEDFRKEWLSHYNRNDILNVKDLFVKISDFIDKDMIHYSNYSNIRMIPSMCDGLKPGQRKILYVALKGKMFDTKKKVIQLANAVAEATEYKHGETSLADTIVKMAQTFVGSNNINLFYPAGNFGSRTQGGEDHANARYTHTYLNSLVSKIFREEDTPILGNLIDDGHVIEPEYFAPIIPMVLVNGASGMGTGYSTEIPLFNPKDIIKNIRRMINEDEPFEMVPWYRGFQGKIESTTNKNGDLSYSVVGNYEIEDGTLHITELPIGKWTDDYIEYLKKIIDDGKERVKSRKEKAKEKKGRQTRELEKIITDYKDKSGNYRVNINITVKGKTLQTLIKTLAKNKEEYKTSKDPIVKKFKLASSIAISNMHLHNAEDKIVKYDYTQDIMQDFYDFRYGIYEKRKAYMIRKLENDYLIAKYRSLYVQYILNEDKNNNKPKIHIKNTQRAKLIEQIEELEFPKLSHDVDDPDKNYNYLLTLLMTSLTKEKIEEYMKECEETLDRLERYKKITIEQLWLSELDELEKEYDKWFKDMEATEKLRDAKNSKNKGEGKKRKPRAKKTK